MVKVVYLLEFRFGNSRGGLPYLFSDSRKARIFSQAP